MGIKEAVELIEFSVQFNVGIGWEDESQVSELAKFMDGVVIPQDRRSRASLGKANDGSG